jgi:hypothetical protein
MIQPLTAAIACGLVAAVDGSIVVDAALHPDIARDPRWTNSRGMVLTPDAGSFRPLDRDRSIAAWSLRYNPVSPSEANRTNAATIRVSAAVDGDPIDMLAIVSGTPAAPVLLALLPVDTVIPDPLPAD